MKHLKIYWMLLVAVVMAAGMAGCGDEEEDVDGTPSELTPSADSAPFFTKGMNFTSAEGVQKVQFTTNKEWTVLVSDTGNEEQWCSVSTICGKAGKAEFNVQVTANQGEGRSTSITLKTGNIEKNIIVTQEMGMLSIHVAEAGTLPSLIGQDKKYEIKELALSGDLNGTDIRFIREMAGADEIWGIASKGVLHTLDMSEANIVEGGDYYYTDGYDYFSTVNNCISERFFVDCPQLKNIQLPKTIISIGGDAFDSSNITSILVPEGVTELGWESFGYCYNLSTVTLPNTITNLGFAPFHPLYLERHNNQNQSEISKYKPLIVSIF